MSIHFEKADSDLSLRQRASDTLQIRGPSNGTRGSQSDALAVLYQLASSPSTASDAMALLHELQVHQVELDLQQEELRRSQADLQTALNRQTQLVERAPVAYLCIDAATVVCEINRAGALLLGSATEDLRGLPLNRLLTAHSAETLQAQLDRAQDGHAEETCDLQLSASASAGKVRTVHAAVGQDATPGHFLVVLMTAAIAPRSRSLE